MSENTAVDVDRLLGGDADEEVCAGYPRILHRCERRVAEQLAVCDPLIGRILDTVKERSRTDAYDRYAAQRLSKLNICQHISISSLYFL